MEEEFIEQEVIEEVEILPEIPIGVYIRVNDNKEIIDINSDIFIQDLTGWIKIDNSTSGKSRDVYAHAQSQYFDKPLIDINDNYNYKFVDGNIIENNNN